MLPCHWNTIVLGVALAVTTPLGAQVHKRTSVDAFRDATQHQLMGCQMAVTTVFRHIQVRRELEPLSRIEACIRNGKMQTERLFTVASRHVMGKPEAVRLLTDYYGAWLAVFEGVMPSSMVPGVDYQVRQGEGLRAMEDAWRRFEIALRP